MAIALEYKGVLGRMEKETIINVNKELCSLEAEVDRLECYVSLLDTNEAAVIRLLYFERKSWSDTGEELKISRRTLFRYRKSALEVLASMYSPIL
jgi:DNA-directed RNA polymerase specialized sigma subunit